MKEEILSAIDELQNRIKGLTNQEKIEKCFTKFKAEIRGDKTNLNALSWEVINEIAENGRASKVFEIGDTKTITLYTGETIELVIIGFNHDKLSEQNKNAGITFAFKDLLDGEFEMNGEYTNVGGWEKCKMRNEYMNRLFKLLPTELQSVIAVVDKNTSIGNESEEIKTTQDRLFLLSQSEVFGNSSYSVDGEGEQYEYFKDSENRVAHRNGSSDWWWLRSPNVAYSTVFCYVSGDGPADCYGAGYSGGVRPAFCL